MKRILGGKKKQKGKKAEDENPPIGDMPPPSQFPNQDPRYSQRDLNQDPRYSGQEQYTGVPKGKIDFRYSDELDPKYVVEDSVRLRQQQIEQMNIQQQQMQKYQQDPRYVQQQQPPKRSQRPLDPSNIVDSERLREGDYERQYEEEPQYDRRPPSYRQHPNEGQDKFHAASARRQQQMEHNVAPPARQQQPQPPRMATSPQQQQPRAAPPQQQPQQRPTRRSSSPQAMQQQQHALPPQHAPPPQKQVFEPTQAPHLKEKAPPPKPAMTVNGIDPVVQMERAAISRELVKQYVADIWNRGDLELIPKVCARGLRFNGSAGMDRVGHEGFSRMVQTIRGSLEDYHCEIHSMVVEGNKAFCRMRFTGRHVGQLLGYEATGKHVSWMGASEFTVVDGLIVKVWELGDMASLEHQLREATDNPNEGEA